MNKARKKLILYAECAVFILLTVLLTVINVVNFTMATDDADLITKRIAGEYGSFSTDKAPKPNEVDPNSQSQNDTQDNAPPDSERTTRKRFGGFGEMGPNSPELNSSTRYFTYAFDENGSAEKVAFKISAVTESEAEEWAKSLINGDVGWTRANYRYRVYEHNGKTYVTVIDQGRELLPSYRILIVSVCGGAVMLVLSLLILVLVGKRLFKPLEESDRKQKQFISNVESEFKVPLTIINANTELLEKENGPSEYMNIINKQVRKMTAMVKDLAALSIFDEKDMAHSKVNLSNLLSFALDSNRMKFNERGIRLDMEITPDIIINGDEGAMKKVLSEIIDNSLKFAKTEAKFVLKKPNDRIIFRQINDANLPGSVNGSVDRIFDRFTTLDNAVGRNGVGLGLSYVKDAVNAHNGRINARVNDGVFTLQIDL